MLRGDCARTRQSNVSAAATDPDNTDYQRGNAHSLTDVGSSALNCVNSGGAKGIRTPDLLDANETRYQLRHSPLR
jgi:hypothetical protein